MIRFLLCLLTLFFVSPVLAGPYEDAMENYNNVFLYIYTPQCGYCKKFEPNYNRLKSVYGKNCKFVKIDATTDYGSVISYNYKVKYVPYVALLKPREKDGFQVPAKCLLEYSCISRQLSGYFK